MRRLNGRRTHRNSEARKMPCLDDVRPRCCELQFVRNALGAGSQDEMKDRRCFQMVQLSLDQTNKQSHRQRHELSGVQ